jgi:hypothetical protein
LPALPLPAAGPAHDLGVHGIMEPADFGQDSNFRKESTVTVLFDEIERGKTKFSIIYPKPGKKEQMEVMLNSGMREGWIPAWIS